jgi:hypothetical protein
MTSRENRMSFYVRKKYIRRAQKEREREEKNIPSEREETDTVIDSYYYSSVL